MNNRINRNGMGGVRFLKLDPETCKKYRDTLAEFYYGNMIVASCIGKCEKEHAYRKIEEMTAYVGEGKAAVFGCVVNDELAGYLWSYPFDFRSEHRLYVSEFYVSERFRRQGIGSELLRMAEREAEELGIRALYLHTEPANKEAIRLYESEGYRLERAQLRKELTHSGI